MNIPNKLSLTELESLLKSDNEQEIIEALMYAVFNIDEPRWIQEIFGQELEHKGTCNYLFRTCCQNTWSN